MFPGYLLFPFTLPGCFQSLDKVGQVLNVREVHSNCPYAAGLPGPGGEQDKQRLSLGSGQQKPAAGRSQGTDYLSYGTHLSLQDTEMASTSAGSHSKQGKGAQTTEGLGLTPGAEARPCPEAARS